MTTKSSAVGLLVAVALIASCSTTPTPDQSPSELPELGSGPAVGIAEAQGIVVEIWLDRPKVQVGER